jgi:hypothetical protein
LALVELGWVWVVAFPSGWWRGAAWLGDGGRLAQNVGCMGGDIQQDNVGHSQYVVLSRKGARVAFGGALPFDGVQ